MKPPAVPYEWKGPRGPDGGGGMSMDRATMAAFAAAVPDSLVRNVVADNVRPVPC